VWLNRGNDLLAMSFLHRGVASCTVVGCQA
jgi:hypothetical protein